MSIPEFWKLLAASRLLSAAQVQRLAEDFEKEKTVASPTVKNVAQWLMDLHAISKYQAQVLIAGKPGPFFYGDYKVYERIEKGPLTRCYRAIHHATKYCVILRFATGPLLKEQERWSVASENTLAAAQIASPFVQHYFEPVDLQRFKFLVSEDIRGSSLDETLASGKLPPAEACRLMRQVAIGLAAMHSAGRAHGDMRPGSVMLETFGSQPPNVKLLFDAAELPSPHDLSDLQAGSRLERIADYLAPELLAAGRPPDALSDIYALGATLYALLAGKPPFAGGDAEQKLKRQLSEPARPLETMGVPAPLAQLVMYLMAKNPDVRYKSATQVAEQLALFVSPAALSHSPPPPPPTLAAFEQHLRQKAAKVVKPQAKRQAAAEPVAPPIAPSPVISAPTIADERPQTSSAPAAMGEFAIKTATASRSARSADEILRQRKLQGNRNLMLGIAGVALLTLVALIGGLVLMMRGMPTLPPVAKAGPMTPTPLPAPKTAKSDGGQASASTETSSSAPTPKQANSAASAQQVVPDDGKSLWASPTSGQPVTFRCVPPEGEIFIIVRPAAMLASDEGRRVLAALGPALASEQETWEKASGCEFEEIEQLHVTLHNNDAKFPRTSFVVKTIEPQSKLELLARWGDPDVATEGDEAYYTGASWAYYIPKSPEEERTFAMGQLRDIKDVAAAAGEPPPVFRELERLRRLTDADRHFTLLFYPQFLFDDDGEPLFAGDRAKVRQPLAWLLGDYVRAVSVSSHFGEEFYFEARMRSSLDKEPYALAEELRERLDKIPGSLEDYLVSLNAPPFWRKLASRYPLMLREVQKQTRIGVENEMAVVNSVLPDVAAHNLVLGGELLVSTAPGQAVAIANSGVPAASGPNTVADALQIKTSYSFDQQSLEFAMRDLEEDVKSNLQNTPLEFAIKIIGDDLKLDGITRNQSIRDFKQENQTVADILTALVRKANPVTTVKDPSEKDQKLVWLIGPDPDSPAKPIVLITTRNAAKTKKYTLPPQFVEKGKK